MNTKLTRVYAAVKAESKPVQAVLATITLAFCYAVFVTLSNVSGSILKAALDTPERPLVGQPQERPIAPQLDNSEDAKAPVVEQPQEDASALDESNQL